VRTTPRVQSQVSGETAVRVPLDRLVLSPEANPSILNAISHSWQMVRKDTGKSWRGGGGE
jgi:hypothetical protein